MYVYSLKYLFTFYPTGASRVENLLLTPDYAIFCDEYGFHDYRLIKLKYRRCSCVFPLGEHE